MRSRLAIAAVALLLAGCVQAPAGGETSSTGPAPTGGPTPSQAIAPAHPAAPPSAAPAPPRMDVHGLVVDEALRPLWANVTLLETNATQETGPSGAFRFDGLRPDVYFLTARAEGFRPKTLSVGPEQAAERVRFVLEADPSAAPYNTTLHFRGRMECAFEALILSPGCDTLVTDPHGLGRPDLGLFNTTNAALLDVQGGWRTVVADVVFDPSGQRLLDGLRVTVQGTHDQGAGGTYEQYGRFSAPESFTFRLEPGGTYPDGTGAVPHNTTAFRFEAFPQSHGWHAACAPGASGETCFLGVGFGLDVQFDLYLTVFYGQPAPEGYTLRDG